MKNANWVNRGVLGIAILVAISMAALANPDVMDKSFDVKENGWLKVESDIGSIEVEARGGDKVEVKVVREIDTRREEKIKEFLDNLVVEMVQRDNDVIISAEFQNNWHRRNWDYNDVRVEFIITVPKKFNVDLSTAGGSISVGDLEGKVEVETAGGSLLFGNINGTVRGRTAGGSIKLESCVGNADVRTSGGSIKIGDVDGDVRALTSGGSIKVDKAKGDVLAETSGGSINIEEVMGNLEASTSGGSVKASISKQPEGDCSLETSGGSVTVYLAEDIAVDVNAKSSWGRISSDFDIAGWDEDEDESYARGTINGGGPKLYLRTSAGKVRIRKMY